MSEKILNPLCKLLADTYALYLKTQNFHWHVRGPNFKSLHELFEDQYTELADAVDTIAERILALGGTAPASFKQFLQLTSIKEGQSHIKAEAMIDELYKDHQQVINDMNAVIKIAQQEADEGTISLLGERIAQHEKARWMLDACKT